MGPMIVLSIIWFLFALLTKRMAVSRGRRAKLWLPIGLICGPFSALVLLVLGKAA